MSQSFTSKHGKLVLLMCRDHLILKRQCCEVGGAVSRSMGGVVRKQWVHILVRDPYKNNCRVCVIASKHILVVFPSYSDLLMLKYGNRMEKSWVACHWVEEEGLSLREVERAIEAELFLDKYPWWGLGTPYQMVILHEMFLHAAGWGQKEAECMCHRGHQSSIPYPNPEADQSAMELVGY